MGTRRSLFLPSCASVYGADASIGNSVNRFTQLYIVADESAAASANIQTGAIAASTIMILRTSACTQGPTISFLASTCLSISGLSNGDVIALFKDE